jgi:hypothetical protein
MRIIKKLTLFFGKGKNRDKKKKRGTEKDRPN